MTPSIVRIVQTCGACPSQWEGFLADGRAFYIRFRYGHLKMTAHPVDPLAEDAAVLLEYDDDDSWLGDMDYDRLRDLCVGAGISAPEQMESPRKMHPHIVRVFMP